MGKKKPAKLKHYKIPRIPYDPLTEANSPPPPPPPAPPAPPPPTRGKAYQQPKRKTPKR
tara:strand:+ start:35 stop:211 length:177 start_codon:yes stop_codon:yes gene_type:complete